MPFSFRLCAILLFASLSAACGAKSKGTDTFTTAAASRAVVASPELPGTPMAVCPRLAEVGLAASSYAVDGGFALELGTFDEAFAEELRTRAAAQIELQRALEVQLETVVAEKRDDGDGIYIRFMHDDELLLDQVADILERGVNKRPAAARRVSFRRDAGYVDMQLPNGGRMITAKTDEAARDTVRKWTNREPTALEFISTDAGFKIEVRSSDSERIDDLRTDAIQEIFLCPQHD